MPLLALSDAKNCIGIERKIRALRMKKGKKELAQTKMKIIFEPEDFRIKFEKIVKS